VEAINCSNHTKLENEDYRTIVLEHTIKD
jgi:hypothetical protein